jgi:FkbM family methyltransferase
MTLAQSVKSLVRRFGFDVIRYRPNAANTQLGKLLLAIADVRTLSEDYPDLEEGAFLDFCCKHARESTSQLFQDLFVLFTLREKSNGFFVEFGATNGRDLSNTYLLEKRYGWKGILAEPAKGWRDELSVNRSCALDFRCVWTKDGDNVTFNEAESGEYSTIQQYASKDHHARSRSGGERYSVETVSLNSLLRDHRAPAVIDYMSIDTEGSELDILSQFDFSQFQVNIITVEHNHTANRGKVHALLTTRGFVRRFDSLSLWDDWYVAKPR